MMCNPTEFNNIVKNVDDSAIDIENDFVILQFLHASTILGNFVFCDVFTIYDFFLELERNLVDEDDSEIVDGYFVDMTDGDVYKFLSTLFWDGILPHNMNLPYRFKDILFDDLNNLLVDVDLEWSIMQRLLTLSGDVESNPGPAPNLELVLRRKIEALERARLRQEEKNKTLVRKLRQVRKSQKFHFQIGEDFIDAAKEVASSIVSPTTIKAAGYAGMNFVMPGSGTAAATVVEGGKILKKIDSATKSIDDLARSCADQIPTAFAQHSSLTHMATMTLDTINKVATKLSAEGGILTGIENLITKISSAVSGTSLLITILVIIICFGMDWKIACAVIMMVLLYFGWPQSVISKIKDLLFGYKFQMVDISDRLISILGQILFTLLAFFGVSKIPTDKWYDSIIKRLDSIPKAFSGGTKIWEAAGKTFEYVQDEFKHYVLQVSREDLAREHGIAGEVSRWVERVKFYMEAPARNDIAKNTETVKEVKELYDQMYRWKHTTSYWKSLPLECQRIISSLTPTVNELHKLYTRSTVHEGGPRKMPLGIFLSGDSGSGKSELLVPLYTTLLAHRDYNLCKNINNEVYVRNYETEYWDGYVAQKIVIFDDAFQMKDTPGNPSPEFMEAIRLLNTAPAHVHCADLNDKGRFFSSEICIYTTNLHHNFANFIKSVNCPEAAIRRLNMCAYRIMVSPEYTREVIVNGQVERRLDKNLVRNCQLCREFCVERGLPSISFCAHVQRFVPYDMFTDEVIGDSLTYGQLVAHLKAEDTQLLNSEKRRMDMVDMLSVDPTMFDYKPQMNGDDVMFSDAQETHGAIDLSVPTDVVAYQTLITYLRHCMELPNVNEDQILADLAAHPQLFGTYQRRLHCGIRNVNIACDSSLQAAHDAAGIHFNYDTDMWFSYRHLRTTVKIMCDSFSAWVSKLGEQVRWFWNHCGFIELISLIYMGVYMIFMFSSIYSAFTAEVCPVCKFKNNNCVCIRWYHDGIIFQGQYYTHEAFDEIKEECLKLQPKIDGYVAESNSSAPNVLKTNAPFRVENSSAPLQPKTTAFKVENSSAPVQPKTQNFKIEGCNQVPLLDVDSMLDQYDREGGLTEKRLPFANALQTLQNKQVELNEILKTIPTVNLTQDYSTELYKDKGCQAIESAIVRKSMYALHSSDVIFGNVMFVKGTTFLVNYHFIALLQKKMTLDAPLFCTNASGVQIEFTLRHMVEKHIRLEKNGREVDAALVPLPVSSSKVHIHPNITRHFIKVEDLATLTGTYSAQLPSYSGRRLDFLYPNLRSLMDVRMSFNEEHISEGNFRMPVNFCWQYYGATSDGDCGGPLIINNEYATRKILGIHMASRELSNGSQGLTQTITQEMLNMAFDQLPFEYQCYSEIDIPLEELPLTEDVTQGSVPLTSGLMIHGITTMANKSGGNTKLQPSVLFDVVPHRTKPAILRPTNGVDPMHKGLLKFGKNVPRLDPEMVNVCANDVYNNLFVNDSHRDILNYKRKLTYLEAVCGVDDDEFLAPINRSTSMGYPYTVLFNNLRGKRAAFGEDENWTLDSDLAKEVEHRATELESDCYNGIQRGVYWSDTLKDERRDIPKVDAGKTRVFCGGPAHFTIKFRQYFLGFAAWIMHNRNANEVSTGTNVYSGDWNDIVRKLASRGASLRTKKMLLRVIAGDFGNFDGSLNAQILWRILDMINDWYDDGDENRRIRRGLWAHIVHAIHINGNVVYQSTHSQPSGCPITAILNSIYNSIIVRMVYLICAIWHRSETGEDFVSMEKFNQFVAMVSYGDDNIIAMAEKILDWFNQVLVTKAFELIGHEYTDEAKTGNIVPVRDISEIAYLKRKFVWDDSANRYIAPLALEVIMEIVQWTKRGLAADSITLANIDVAMRELSLHDQSVFDVNAKLIRDACIEKGVPYRFATYNEYRGEVLNIPFLCEMRGVESDFDQIYSLRLTKKKLPRNFVEMNKKSKSLFINEYDVYIMLPKLQLFCAYRNIKVTTQNDLLRSLVTELC